MTRQRMTLQEIIAKAIYDHELRFFQNGTADGMKTAENIITSLQKNGVHLQWACDQCPGFECGECRHFESPDIVQAYHEERKES